MIAQGSSTSFYILAETNAMGKSIQESEKNKQMTTEPLETIQQYSNTIWFTREEASNANLDMDDPKKIQK